MEEFKLILTNNKGEKMKNLFFGAFIVLFGLVFTIDTYSQEEPKAQEKKETVTEESGIVNTICPVSGEEIDHEKTFTYKGKTYGVCCDRCMKKIKEDPEKYISRLSEDGKSLKKKKQ